MVFQTGAARDECRCRAKTRSFRLRWACCSQVADSQTVAPEDLEWMEIAGGLGNNFPLTQLLKPTICPVNFKRAGCRQGRRSLLPKASFPGHVISWTANSSGLAAARHGMAIANHRYGLYLGQQGRDCSGSAMLR